MRVLNFGKIRTRKIPYTDLFYAVTVLGPLIFNNFLCDIFYFMDDVDIAGYADVLHLTVLIKLRN